MRKKIFIIIFGIIIYGLLLMYPINFLLVKTNRVNITNFYSTSITSNTRINRIKQSIINKSINYLFMYDKVIEVHKKINYKLNKLLYNSVKLEYVPTGINNDNEYIFRNDSKYILYNNLSDKELNHRFNDQLDFFNNLDTDVYLFIPYRYEYLNLNNDSNIRNMSTYRTKFLSKLDSNIKVSEFYVDNEKDYNQYFYHTDHHYNMYGALKSYETIMNSLNKPVNNYEVDVNNINYLGSIAKSSYLKDITDNFYTSNFKLANNTVLVDGKVNDTYKPKTIKESTNPFYDQYVHYYNGLFGLREYNFNNNKDNLLILEDSYGWQIDDLIASNYNKTYIIDLRYYDFNNKPLSLKEFKEKYNVKDVLLIYEAGSVFFDQYDYDMKDKVTK